MFIVVAAGVGGATVAGGVVAAKTINSTAVIPIAAIGGFLAGAAFAYCIITK